MQQPSSKISPFFIESRNSPHFVKFGSSLPRSHKPTTCHFPEPDHAHKLHFVKINFRLSLPFTPSSSRWPLSTRFPHQSSLRISLLPHMCHAPRPSQLSLIWSPKQQSAQIMQLLNTQLYPLSWHFVPLMPQYLPQHPILKHSLPIFFN